jgi:hypothetical protein
LAVLPFADFSSDHQAAYLVDGLTDEITSDLANLQGLHVIAADQRCCGMSGVRIVSLAVFFAWLSRGWWAAAGVLA